MPIICDVRPAAGELVEEYRNLRQGGEPVVLVWTDCPPAGDMAVPTDGTEMDSALENEVLVCLPALSAWLAAGDFDRVLMICDSPGSPSPTEQHVMNRLLDLGAETIEVLAPQDARDLSQSWRSGRRTNARLWEPAS